MSLVYLDVESTGLDPDTHQVWEIAFAVDDRPIVSSAVDHTLAFADPVALEVGNYWSRNLTFADPQFEFDIQSLLDGATLVGANPAFDAAMLRRRWGRAPWHYRLLDIETYAMPAFGEDVPQGLASIAERLDVQAPDHTAAGDVHTLRECHRKLLDWYNDGPCHDADVVGVRSRFRVECTCGLRGEWRDTLEEAGVEAEQHEADAGDQP